MSPRQGAAPLLPAAARVIGDLALPPTVPATTNPNLDVPPLEGPPVRPRPAWSLRSLHPWDQRTQRQLLVPAPPLDQDLCRHPYDPGPDPGLGQAVMVVGGARPRHRCRRLHSGHVHATLLWARVCVRGWGGGSAVFILAQRWIRTHTYTPTPVHTHAHTPHARTHAHARTHHPTHTC